MSFLPLREALSKPEPFMETDFAKIGRPGVLHQAFQGLDKVNILNFEYVLTILIVNSHSAKFPIYN